MGVMSAAKSRNDCGSSCFHPIRKGWGWEGALESSERGRESEEKREKARERKESERVLASKAGVWRKAHNLVSVYLPVHWHMWRILD
jgi:hypothetical protein